nr:BrnT family toxin [uncultured Devosia sp.]
MIDLGGIVGFQWDAGNDRKSADKHAVSQSEAEQVFLNEPLLLVADDRHSAEEPRFHALGKTDDARLLLIAFTLRADDTLIRIISARDMNRRERVSYDKA